MPELPINTLSSWIGLALLVFGMFLLLAGFQIIKVEKISVAPGRRTWAVGIIFAIVGLILLIPETREQISTETVEQGGQEPTASTATNSSEKEYLSALSPIEASVGYQDFSIGKYLFTSSDPFDKISAGDAIRAHGVEYPYGLYAHAPSKVTYNLGGRYSELEVVLAMVDWIACGDGAVYVIQLDGEELYRSGKMFSYSEPISLKVNVSNGHMLELITEAGNAGNMKCDWTIWGDPLLYK